MRPNLEDLPTTTRRLGMAVRVLWGAMPDEVVGHIARAVNGSAAIRFCAVSKAFRSAQPKLVSLVLGGYTHKADPPYDDEERRVPVEDAEEGLTVRVADGLRGLRIIEMIGERYGSQLQRLHVALPSEAVRADPFPQPRLGSTLTDLRELHMLGRSPGTYTDDDEYNYPSPPDYDEEDPTDDGDRVGSVSQLITSTAKTLQVLYLDCCEYMEIANVDPLMKLLRPDMKRIFVDLTPYRWRPGTITICTFGVFEDPELQIVYKNMMLDFAGVLMHAVRSLEPHSRVVLLRGGWISTDMAQHTASSIRSRGFKLNPPSPV
jgi:hypothetical protein